MAQCKECGDVFGVVDIRNGVCKYCITGEIKPSILIKTAKTYLTDDERAKIIEEEELRATYKRKAVRDGIEDQVDEYSTAGFGIMIGALLYVAYIIYT